MGIMFFMNNIVIMYAPTSLNRTVTVRRLTAARLRKTAVGLRPLCGFSPPHFFVCEKLLAQFPYRKQKNVSYSRNVKRHLCKIFNKEYKKIL
jgi:hypothetical protein